jgi:hypothetical protein
MPVVRTLGGGDAGGEDDAGGEARGPGELVPGGGLALGELARGGLVPGDAVPADKAGTWAGGLAPEDAGMPADRHEDAVSATATSGITQTTDVG